MRCLMWFRSDLRTLDNSALAAAASAAAAGGDMVAAFIVSPKEWQAHDLAAVRVDFMLRTLREVSAALGRLNIPLLVARAPTAAAVPKTLLSLARKHRCDSLFFNREYEIDESRRDESVSALFAREGLKVSAHDDQGVLPPGSVLSKSRTPLKVFTPFRRAWLAEFQRRGALRPMPAPAKQRPTGIKPSPVPARIPGFASKIDQAFWPAGESHAAERLMTFVSSRITEYKDARNIPGTEGTSTLSPYLAIGAVSPRQCLAAAAAANPVGARSSPLTAGNASINTWITELIWREFYIHITAAFPRISMGRAFKPQTDRLPWSYDKRAFDRWARGRTGFPIVDAAMRQLLATGWMHNRLRMITAMFLTKDLFIDWRWGERHFMRNLVDGFFASNNGGWQWSASTGTDAVPYFRIFNPTSQGRACDPSGDFIRRYCPEIAHLDARAIHEPFNPKNGLTAPQRKDLDYPRPMINHAEARLSTLRAFKSLRA